MKKPHHTTNVHFSIFKEEFMKWYEVFKLQRLEVVLKHEDWSNSLGWCSFDHDGQTVTVGLSVDWGDHEPTTELIRRTAFHECMEALLWQGRELALERFVTEREIDAEWHRIINTLESILFMGDVKS